MVRHAAAQISRCHAGMSGAYRLEAFRGPAALQDAVEHCLRCIVADTTDHRKADLLQPANMWAGEMLRTCRCRRKKEKNMSEPADILLFSYGTLQLAQVQLSSFGRLLDGEDDAMIGYRTEMIEITDPDVLRESGQRFHPLVVSSETADDEVKGKVFRITAKELAAADAYEVSDYRRIEVPLKSGRHAWVYVKA